MKTKGFEPLAWGHALVHDFMHEDSRSINLQHRPGFPSQTAYNYDKINKQNFYFLFNELNCIIKYLFLLCLNRIFLLKNIYLIKNQ